MPHPISAGLKAYVRPFSPLILFLVLIFFTGIANADEYHYTNILVGDRASGMGGAYVAISDDATGLYYNPAGSVYSSGKNLSASVNAYYSLTRTYEGVIGGRGWDRKASSLLPNYFGIIQPLGKFKFGFSWAVPDSNQEDQDQEFHDLNLIASTGATITNYVINFNNDDKTYNFGPSLAAEITSDLSAGITLYYHRRKAQWILNQIVTLDDGTHEWTNLNSETTEAGLRPVAGLMWSPAEKISFGLAVSKTILFYSDKFVQYTCSDTVADGYGCDTSPNYFDRQVATSSSKRAYPLQIAAGAAYFATSSLLLTGDLNYYSPAGSRVTVLNVALGTEYYLNKNWAVRGGLFTNMANTPEIDPNESGQPEHIDLYGGSLSLSYFTRNTSVTLGGNMSFGSGDAQIISGNTAIQDAETLGWLIFLSSSYSY